MTSRVIWAAIDEWSGEVRRSFSFNPLPSKKLIRSIESINATLQSSYLRFGTCSLALSYPAARKGEAPYK